MHNLIAYKSFKYVHNFSYIQEFCRILSQLLTLSSGNNMKREMRKKRGIMRVGLLYPETRKRRDLGSKANPEDTTAACLVATAISISTDLWASNSIVSQTQQGRPIVEGGGLLPATDRMKMALIGFPRRIQDSAQGILSPV